MMKTKEYIKYCYDIAKSSYISGNDDFGDDNIFDEDIFRDDEEHIAG